MATKEAPQITTHLCPKYERAMEIIGKRWTGLIIRVLCDGPLRFNELHKVVDKVSDRVLTERLRELETAGIVERTVIADSAVRVEYSLTEKGKSMQSVFEAVQSWADDWIRPEDMPPLEETK